MEITFKGVKYVDAQAMHVLHPATFDVPDSSALAMLQTGNWVKVSANQERFWVVVTDINNGVITGRIDNDLLQDKLQAGDIIQFPITCIYDIIT